MARRICPSFFCFVISVLVKNAVSDIQCLVSRPGFGLVSEQCPAHTVGCRIRIQRNAVFFYDFLDSNQFVCVLKGEFGELRSSGCVRKRSGNIRCWCFGRSNCNTAENSKLIYEAFVSENEQKLLDAIQQVDFADLAQMPTPIGDKEIGATTPKTTTSRTKFASAQTLAPKKLLSTSTKNVKLLFHRPPKEPKTSPPPPQSPQAFPSPSPAPMPKPLPLKNSTFQSEYDRRNRVHVIHVSSRDQYEPVFGSAALRRIMEEERERLKAESEIISEEIDDDLDEEDDTEDDLPSSSAVLEKTDQPIDDADGAAQISRRVAQRSELAKPKASRMEQRERSSSSASSERLENALGDEYFDSSFFAPASTSNRQPNFLHVLFNLTFFALFLAIIDQ